MSNLLQTVIPAAATFLVGYQGALTRTSRLRKSIRADMDMLDALPDGHPLHGENTYRLQVPADVPVQQFWSVTVYNKQTAALFRESTHVALGSLQPGLQRNEDGTTDIYFGPEAPAGHESNWLHTPAGKGWWPWFRFFGPEVALFEKTWKLPDIEKLK